MFVSVCHRMQYNTMTYSMVKYFPNWMSPCMTCWFIKYIPCWCTQHFIFSTVIEFTRILNRCYIIPMKFWNRYWINVLHQPYLHFPLVHLHHLHIYLLPHHPYYFSFLNFTVIFLHQGMFPHSELLSSSYSSVSSSSSFVLSCHFVAIFFSTVIFIIIIFLLHALSS